MTTALQMRLDKFYNLSWIKLNKFYNPIMPRTNLNISSNIRFIYKFAKFLTKTSNKRHKPKIYNKKIDNLIYENR